jgi:hypothetical protein
MTASTSSNVVLLEQTDAYVIAAWRRLMMLVWKGQASATGIERSSDRFRSWAERHPEGAAFLIVVSTQRTQPPDEETRAAMERTHRVPEGPFRGMATLIEAEGFIAATVRSIMTRLQGGGGGNVFRTADEVAAWAAALLDDPGFTAEGFAEALREARQGRRVPGR